jgi:hypothetical protein
MFGLTTKINGFILTRDSIILTLVIVGSIAGYLALGPSPATWTWQQWMQAVVTISGILAGKLATSPLPSKSDAERVTLPVKES